MALKVPSCPTRPLAAPANDARTRAPVVISACPALPHRVSRRKSSTFSPGTVAAVENTISGSLPERAESVLTDGPPFSATDRKPKARRASEGNRMGRRDKAGELKCEHCGKAYKHGSCLSKHLWEHTPQWQLTSKLLISKHQQVQLLEAASVLVAMNQDGSHDSDRSSISGISVSTGRDEPSSAETTPPPNDASRRSSKRLSGVCSQSLPTCQEDLAAAVGLLSCSQNTPTSGPTIPRGDVPPVPPLPPQYMTPHMKPNVDAEMDDDEGMWKMDA
ncbi:hypothetical protein K470DRAFT_264196 [Piedraia hortae CBS 480.64]|uniref:C2H2-type domain-containing protein n=1 Tax=Piedraia hortae CBS 480.64 TaxID=1314780 RepID=A0A6A7C0G8_9PEZI|nr:hypothetical protein K470DRAFT_264196 [Piedraia hortae CBS 480.64]